MTRNEQRADRIVAAYLQSRHWDSSRFGVSSDDWLRDAERMQRCENAAENGADGSTHREIIQDMREGLRDWLHERSRRKPFGEYYYHVEDICMRHFDDVEAWHERNGSIDMEVG